MLEMEITQNQLRVYNISLLFLLLSLFFFLLPLSPPNEQTPCLTLYGGARFSATPSCGQRQC